MFVTLIPKNMNFCTFKLSFRFRVHQLCEQPPHPEADALRQRYVNVTAERRCPVLRSA